MLFFGVFLVRGSSTKRVLAQLTLPQRGYVGQAAGPEVAPPSVLYGYNFIEGHCVGSRMASSASSSYRKGHFCDQFFTKFNSTVCMIGNPRETG